MDETDRIVGVTSATETPFYDGTNCYDGQIFSATIMQVIEKAQYSVSKVLGEVDDADPSVMGAFHARIAARGLTFKKNARGRHRFFFSDGDEVDTLAEQRRAFHLNSTGAAGTWDDESTAWAKEMAAAVASVWSAPAAQAVQRRFVAGRIRLYAFSESKKIVDDAPETEVGRAFVAAYLSFAVNNPTRANKHLGIGMKSFDGAAWTKDWLIHVLKELTFGPRIAIYPHRYDAIRKPLERYYGLDLPDFASELKTWLADMGMEPTSREDVLDEDPQDREPTFTTVKEIQGLLISMGYDLGPSGADGKMGDMTKDAVIVFQGTHELEPDGIVGPATRKALLEAWRSQTCE